MTHTILHKLFGWDYIAWSNSVDNGVARVTKLPDGNVVYFRYKITKVLDTITKPEQVLWLTCNPSKYFPNLADGDKKHEKND